MKLILRRVALSLLVSVLLTTGAFGDRLRLKNGTVLEGTVIPRSDGSYWVKPTDAPSRIVPAGEVLTHEKGPVAASPTTPGSPATVAPPTAGPGVPAGAGAGAAAGTGTLTTPANPSAPRPVLLSFSATRAKAATVQSALAAVALWQTFVDNNPTSPDLPAAQQELATWKALADGGAEKIKGRWIGGDERQAILDKAAALGKEADEMLKADQTLQAVKKLEEAAAIYPNSFQINFTLGYVAMLQSNEDKAVQWFTEALRVKPDSPEALANLGVVQVNKRQYLVGIASLRKALTLQDRKEIVHNLVTAISATPPMMHRNKDVKEAMDAAQLLASKYGITGPGDRYLIVEPTAPTGKERGESEAATGMWSGSGFVISEDGMILTNRHVAEGGKTLMVLLPDGTSKAAEVIVIDDEQDLALLRVKTGGQKLAFVKLAAADAPADGAECTVIGFPLLDRLGAAVKITRGVVSSGGAGVVRKGNGPDVLIDAKVNPGNSGGPILDRFGDVMAIVSMKTVGSATEDTYGLGISAGQIRRFLTKNKITLPNAAAGGTPLSVEEVAAKVKPSTVCILATK